MGLGELDQAFAEYDKAYEERNHNLAMLKASMYDNLRADPRYRALLQKLGLPQTDGWHGVEMRPRPG
jgi:hypothetical protein